MLLPIALGPISFTGQRISSQIINVKARPKASGGIEKLQGRPTSGPLN